MLVNASKMLGFPVLSLHVGGPIARINEEIIDPRKMQVVGYFVDGPMVTQETGNILEPNAIREFSPMGMIIDSVDSLTDGDEVVRLKKILELDFSLHGLKVETKKGTRLGKVIDCTIDAGDFRVMQIIVQRPALKALIDPELVISRKEIVKVTNDKIIIKDEEDKLKKRAIKEDFVPNFVNPFRSSEASRVEVSEKDN